MKPSYLAALCIMATGSVALAEPPTTAEAGEGTYAPEGPKAPADECAASFPERLADAKHAFNERAQYVQRYEKSGAEAKLAWFDAHCRFLSELERVVRKLDDPNAFVCDPKAKGRPKGLVSYVELAALEPPPYSELQGFHNENHLCLESDQRDRVAVLLREEMTKLEQLEFACYQDTRPMCAGSAELIAKVRAKGIR